MRVFPDSGAYASAAELYAGIMQAALVSPEDDGPHLLPDWVPVDADQPHTFCTLRIERTRVDGAYHVEIADDAASESQCMAQVHGPVRHGGAPQKAQFRFHAQGASSRMTVTGTRGRLLTLADTVRKQWALFGGGPKPAELVKPKAPRRATWPTTIVRVWLQQMEGGADHAGAVLTGERIDARFYPGNTTTGGFVLAAPMQVDGLPDGMVSAVRNDGRWVVADHASGLKLGNGAGSRKAAETEALKLWSDAPEEKREHALKQARATLVDHDAARDAWCVAHGITVDDPADLHLVDPMPDADLQPAPAEPIAEPTPVADADPCPPIGEMAQDVDPIAWQVRAARPTTIYATPVYRIGVHEWCTVVYAHGTYVACTDHLWRRVEANTGRFFSSREWPTYNSDRTHSGLPVSIGRKVFDPSRAQIEQALADAREGILPAWAGDDIRSTLRAGIDAQARQAESLQILREQREMVARVKAKAAAAHVDPEPIACTPSPAVVEMLTPECDPVAQFHAFDRVDVRTEAGWKQGIVIVGARSDVTVRLDDGPEVTVPERDVVPVLSDGTPPPCMVEMRNDQPEDDDEARPDNDDRTAAGARHHRCGARAGLARAGSRLVRQQGTVWGRRRVSPGLCARRDARLLPRLRQQRGGISLLLHAGRLARCGLSPTPPPAWGKWAQTSTCNIEWRAP